MLTTASRHNSIEGGFNRFFATVRHMIETHAARRQHRLFQREIARLAETSPHLLADVGLTPMVGWRDRFTPAA